MATTLYNRTRNINTFNEDVGKPAEFQDYTDADREKYLDYLDELVQTTKEQLD